MKFSRIISSLHNSTKATVVACSALLAFTAAVLFFLMLFPIKMRDRSAALAAPVIIETTTVPVIETTATTTTREPPHTLSTWAAVPETIATTADPDEIPWYDKLFTSTVETDEFGSTITTTTTTTTTVYIEPYIETAPPVIDVPDIVTVPPEPETQPPEPETQPPVQEVITEPPVTQPPEAEIINADPVAPF